MIYLLSQEKLIKEAENAIKWIKEYVNKTGAKGVVIGNSGGKDSATVIAMATKALGKENILAVSMPCNSVSSDFEDARLVTDTFGINSINIDLTSTFDTMENSINMAIEETLSKESKINMKPRLRMTTLYSIAQTLGYLVIGTGNLSESMVRLYNKMGR